MKKIRLIVAIAIAALMVMGVGYALWSKTLQINAEGYVSTFDVYIDATQTQQTDTDAVAKAATVISYDDAAMATTATIAAGGKFYPGRTATYTFTVKNNGTVNVLLKGIETTTTTGSNPIVRIASLASATAIKAGDTAKITVTVSVPSGETTNPRTGGTFGFTVKPTYEQNP